MLGGNGNYLWAPLHSLFFTQRAPFLFYFIYGLFCFLFFLKNFCLCFETTILMRLCLSFYLNMFWQKVYSFAKMCFHLCESHVNMAYSVSATCLPDTPHLGIFTQANQPIRGLSLNSPFPFLRDETGQPPGPEMLLGMYLSSHPLALVLESKSERPCGGAPCLPRTLTSTSTQDRGTGSVSPRRLWSVC